MAAPIITSFSPSAATPGQLVTITGIGFTGATAVKFGGVDCLFFRVVTDTTIQAYPNQSGVNVITVITPGGTGSLDGFTLILTKVKITDLPQLGRAVGQTDLTYIWDFLRGKLCQAPASALPSGPGGSGGSGTGNIYTALGSPFKVRSGDDTYDYDTPSNTVIITDVRLLGKSDYIVSASDLSNEFENFNPAVVSSGTTSATDAVRVNQSAINITGTGVGAIFTVKTVNNVVQYILQTSLGSGYAINDTFSIASLPGLTFTVIGTAGDFGNLIYDDVNGAVIIVNYNLEANRHISIYADGVLTTALQDYIATSKAQLDKLMIVAAPFLPSLNSSGVLTNPGGLVAWFRPAIEIPTGWAEWLPGRGVDLRGQDPSDIYDSTTNPDGLSQANGTAGGSKQLPPLVEANIPKIQLKLFSGGSPAGNLLGNVSRAVAWSSNHKNGNQDYDMKVASDNSVTQGITSSFGNDTPTGLVKRLDPFRIVNFIYSTQTA